MAETEFPVLVIEDNFADYILVEEYLQEKLVNLRTIHAKNFKEAKAILEERKIHFNVILLDLSLPDKDRDSLISEMIELSHGIPVIALTGFEDMNFSVKSLAMGIDDYLLKDDINASSLYKSIIYTAERKKANQKLAESEQRYSSIFQSSPQPMWIFDIKTFKFIDVNRAAVSIYGYSKEEFLSMTILDIRPDEDRELVKKINAEALKNPNKKFLGRARHYKKSKELIEVDIYSNPIYINDKEYRLIIAVDITEKILFENKITRAIIKTQEDERYEIGGELHDNVCQVLASCQMSLGMIQKVSQSPESFYYDQCKKYLNIALEEIRNLSHRLAPAFFHETTLEGAFEILLNGFNVDNRYNTYLYFSDEVKKLSLTRDIQLNLYRILQEQLSNVTKYSKATTVEVDVVIYNHNLKMRIFDNGVGFDTNTKKGGIGLANMKRRSELFAGNIDITSSPGNGCEIMVNIPLQQIAYPIDSLSESN